MSALPVLISGSLEDELAGVAAKAASSKPVKQADGGSAAPVKSSAAPAAKAQSAKPETSAAVSAPPAGPSGVPAEPAGNGLPDNSEPKPSSEDNKQSLERAWQKTANGEESSADADAKEPETARASAAARKSEAPSEAAADMQEPAAEPPQDKKIASTGDADTPAAATKPTVAAQEHKADQAAPKTMEQKTFAAKPDASAARAAAVAAPAPKQEKSSVAGKAAAAKPAAAAARVESEANKPSAAPYAGAPAGSTAPPKSQQQDSDSDSEDDIPLAQRMKAPVEKVKKLANASKPAVKEERQPAKKKRPRESEEEDDDDDEEEEEEFIPKKKKKKVEQSAAPNRRKLENGADGQRREKKKEEASEPRARRENDKKAEDKEVKWETLVHSGVLFPPDYTPHGVKMLYDGKPVDLSPEQEEMATAMAVMTGTAYLEKKQFLDNFWEDWRPVLGKNHTIKSLSKCDFTPIHEWHMAERERKKALSKEEKEKLKKEKDEAEAKFKHALVDGRKEQVGNFRVEPPGLFRGRGDHPKMGKFKRRIYPKDITINIGQGVSVPEHPYKGQQWREVRHDNTVTWLAFWKDPISAKDYKYVWLAANSSFKSESDLAKYEKARKLKDYIGGIRKAYEKDWESSDLRKRQMAVALYFIDKLALRAGHEKDEDEADTVGCCTLKVENVEVLEDNHIKFDFLGKDSIRYENEVAVHPKIHSLVRAFCKTGKDGKAKKPSSDLFDTMDATDLNKRLKDLMDGLSVKVFRTYNASVTLDALLHKDSTTETVDEKKAEYDRANKEVAILCNHQRSVPKGHTGQMQKMEAKLLEQQTALDALERELAAAKKGKPFEGGKARAPESLERQIERKREALRKLEINAKVKEDLKTVALGTSKINYLDPRITVAWCKLHEVPIEKIFNKSLLSKFHWAMEIDHEWRF